MHAAERYDGVVDKLRECNEQLEGTKEAVRELALRFEEVKKRRQQLFQVRARLRCLLWLLTFSFRR
jgi:chromosome segregation ATPase